MYLSNIKMLTLKKKNKKNEEYYINNKLGYFSKNYYLNNIVK